MGARGGNEVTDKELIAAMRRLSVETGSLACVGCGREHSCGIHGCAILREAADRLEALADQLHYAQAERDVVTKRMIALEIERATKEDTE